MSAVIRPLAEVDRRIDFFRCRVLRVGEWSVPVRELPDRAATDDLQLRRRLEEEGTSFRALLDEVRETHAEELLTRGAVPVEDVAFRLGYAEASSFIHAFKRWKGVTPTAFLRRR